MNGFVQAGSIMVDNCFDILAGGICLVIVAVLSHVGLLVTSTLMFSSGIGWEVRAVFFVAVLTENWKERWPFITMGEDKP